MERNLHSTVSKPSKSLEEGVRWNSAATSSITVAYLPFTYSSCWRCFRSRFSCLSMLSALLISEKCPKHFSLLINFLSSAPSCFCQNTRIREIYVCCVFLCTLANLTPWLQKKKIHFFQFIFSLPNLHPTNQGAIKSTLKKLRATFWNSNGHSL